MSEENSNAGFGEIFDSSMNESTPDSTITENEATPVQEAAEDNQGVTPETQQEIDKLWPDGHPNGEKKPAKEDEKRYEYWQSQTDKIKKEKEALEAKVQQAELYAPIAEYFQQNPQALDILEQQLSGQQVQAPTQETQSAEPELQAPSKPELPPDYNPEEIGIRGTPSYEYQLAKEQYLQDMLDYTNKKVDTRLSNFEQQRQAEQMQRQAAQQQLQIQQQLVSEFGFKPNEVRDFMDMVNNRNVGLKDYVDLYNARRGRLNPADTAIDQFAQRQQTLNVPPPLGVATGQAPPTLSEEDMFNLNAIKEWKSSANRNY